MDNVEKIKSSQKIVEHVLGSTTKVSHRTKTKYDLDKKKFENIILNLEQISARSGILSLDFDLDLSKYEELYYNVINDLLSLMYPKEAIEIINFYLYSRTSPEGDNVVLKDIEGNEIILENSSQLYNIIQNIVNGAR
jgi:hypothetical protein